MVRDDGRAVKSVAEGKDHSELVRRCKDTGIPPTGPATDQGGG